ncbi:MAG: response regulator, partial [bacterium]|nr:response regulator [bacterium]
MILIVEDIVSMRKIITSMVRRMGYNDILEAANGAEALEHLRMRTVDVVLTDWLMPEMDGSHF